MRCWAGLATLEIYFIFPATEERQEKMIRSLTNKEVNWAIVSNQPMDGREELRFSATHPLLWNYSAGEVSPGRTVAASRQDGHSAPDRGWPRSSRTSDFSSFSSLSEASIFARLKSLIGTPGTISHLPPLDRIGKELIRSFSTP